MTQRAIKVCTPGTTSKEETLIVEWRPGEQRMIQVCWTDRIFPSVILKQSYSDFCIHINFTLQLDIVFPLFIYRRENAIIYQCWWFLSTRIQPCLNQFIRKEEILMHGQRWYWRIYKQICFSWEGLCEYTQSWAQTHHLWVNNPGNEHPTVVVQSHLSTWQMERVQSK